MSKKYYPIEEAINNVYKELKIQKKDAYDMTNEELIQAEREINHYVYWVEHPEYMQMVPKLKLKGKLILQEDEDE